MPILTIYEVLRAVALSEFADIVVSARIVSLPTGDPLKLRLDIADGSLVDVFISASGRYSYHWERRLTPRGDLYRHDNAPHGRKIFVQKENAFLRSESFGKGGKIPDIQIEKG